MWGDVQNAKINTQYGSGFTQNERWVIQNERWVAKIIEELSKMEKMMANTKLVFIKNNKEMYY